MLFLRQNCKVFQNFQTVLRSKTFRENESPDGGQRVNHKSARRSFRTMFGKRPQSHGTKKNGVHGNP
jgi:hypothetical protein